MERVRKIKEILEDKNIENINVIDFKGRNILADYFIIGEASNIRQMDAVKNEFVKLSKEGALHVAAIEGSSDSGWVVIDTEYLFVHLFDKTSREEYALDQLWLHVDGDDA